MSLKAKGLGVAIAVYLLGQPIQCPFIIPPLVGDAVALTVAQVGSAAASFGGAIAGGAVASNDKRGFDLNSRAAQVEAPEGVPQHNFDQCVDSLVDPAVTVTVTGPVENNGEQAAPLLVNQARLIDASLRCPNRRPDVSVHGSW